MESPIELLEYVFLGSSLRAWLIATLVFLVTFIVLPGVRAIVARRRRTRAAEGKQVFVGVELGGLLITATKAGGLNGWRCRSCPGWSLRHEDGRRRW